MQMETTGLAKENFEELWIDPYDYNRELREAVLLLADRGMKPYIYNAQLCVLPDESAAMPSNLFQTGKIYTFLNVRDAH